MLGLRHFADSAVDLWQGDITQFACDVMVTAANAQLAGGGGVDGAIHSKGGPSILRECQKIGGCATGDAVETSSGELPCQRLIHAVGPIWQGGQQNEAQLLQSAYAKLLRLVAKHPDQHVAIPAISAGAYGYPLKEAANIAMQTTRDTLAVLNAGTIRRVTFVLFNRETYTAFKEALFTVFPETDV